MPLLAYIVSGLAAAAGAVWLVIRIRAARPLEPSFRDMVRHPHRMPDARAIHRIIRARLEAVRQSPEAIAVLVDYFVFEAPSTRLAWKEQRVLAALGSAIHPRLLAILRDPGLHAKLTTVNTSRHSPLPESSLQRVCGLLEATSPPPPESVELVAPFIESGRYEVRREVALFVADVDCAAALQVIARALRDPEGYVRCSTLIGITRSCRGGRLDAATSAALFDMVAAMWPADSAFEVNDLIPDVMLRLDRDRGMARLCEPDVLSASFPGVWNLLKAVQEHSAVIEREKLLPVIEEAFVEPLAFPRTYIVGRALACLGACRHPDDLPLLERCLDHPDAEVVGGAVKGVYAYHSHKETVRDMCQAEDSLGFDALTPVEKQILSIHMLDAEVRNGGFDQYYFNSSGDRWREALAGLKAAGAVEHVRVLMETLRLFPNGTPSGSREARQRELSGIARRNKGALDALSEAWYELSQGDLARGAMRYDIANPEGRLRAAPAG